jgi:hypothetical protein
MVFAFAVLYSCDNYLNKPFTHWFDAIYFSTTTSSTIGFGDFYPVKTLVGFLVSMQALFVFLCSVIFEFFSTKIKSKGYFDQDNGIASVNSIV